MIDVIALTAGRVQTDPELKTSTKNNPYLHLTLIERIGTGEHARTQYIHVWAFGQLAVQLHEAGVGKDSLIWVSGSLELSDFLRSDGRTRDKALKLILKEWGPLVSETQVDIPNRLPSPEEIGVIDGDRVSLPG